MLNQRLESRDSSRTSSDQSQRSNPALVTLNRVLQPLGKLLLFLKELQKDKFKTLRPSPRQREGVTVLSNGLVEIDGAIDDPKFDRASAEPAVGVAEDTFKVFSTPTPPKTITRVASTTLLSNFVGGQQRQVGLITGTGGTLISNGITTVHTTRVFGTYLNANGDGNYAQIVQSTAKVFEDDIKPTAVLNHGSVQHVTELPSFGLEAQDSGFQHRQRPRSNNDFGSGRNGFGSVEVLDAKEEAPTGGRIKLAQTQKKTAINDFKERLKSRFQKFRSRVKDSESRAPSTGRGSVVPVSSGFTSLRGGKDRKLSRGRSLERTTTTEQPERERSSSAETRGFTFRDKARFRSRIRKPEPVTEPDLLTQPSFQQVTTTRNRGFGARRRGSSNRFRDRGQQQSAPQPEVVDQPKKSFKLSRPSLSKDESSPKKPRVTFKKFNRFSRPDIRKSLLQKILNKGKGENTIDPEEVQRKEVERKRQEEEKAQLEQIVQEQEAIENQDPVVNGLQTTLDVSTVFPTENPSTYLKVATIRSPYSFDLDEDGLQQSTRYITVTRTFTSSISQQITKPPVEAIKPTKSSKPFFQTETIPAPENILTSSYPESSQDNFIGLSSSIETLPAVVLASSSAGIGKTPPLKTITETFSTKELMLKTSILPIIVNGKTALHTLTQSFYVTRLVEAVKTLPPMEAYEFIPTKAFTDLSNVLEEAGSEKREQLLPGMFCYYELFF